MTCPKCKSENVNAQMVTDTQLKQKRHGVIYWIFIGWWLQPILWLVFFFPKLFIAIFAPKKYKLKQQHKAMWVCQNCGHTWEA